MLHTQNSSSRNYFLLILAILGLALALRVASFGWNTRLQGDVNLFALTAREMATHHRLYYPMKYEYSDHVEYLTLANPATQHPPLYPFLAGVLGWVFDTDDTFFLLKLLTELTVLPLFVAIVLTGLRQKWPIRRFGTGSVQWDSPYRSKFQFNCSRRIVKSGAGTWI